MIDYCSECGRPTVASSVPAELVGQLIDRAAHLFNVPAAEIMSRNRRRRVTLVRYVCMAALRERHGVSLLEIGDLFDRDHTTCLYGIRKAPADMVAQLLDDDATTP
jgi:chromosomal replication initiator protein